MTVPAQVWAAVRSVHRPRQEPDMTNAEQGDRPMDEYPYETAEAEPDVDPRVVAMHRVVDLEKQHERAVRDAEQRQKMAAIARDELGEARDQLAGLLGYPSNSDVAVKAMDGAEARKLAQLARDYR